MLNDTEEWELSMPAMDDSPKAAAQWMCCCILLVGADSCRRDG